MSNVNRERKLKPHQRKIWTDAFKASMSHVSIEAAERKAWQAVDICERVGAFHESVVVDDIDKSDFEYRTAWKTLADWFEGQVPFEGKLDTLHSAIIDFVDGELNAEQFRIIVTTIPDDPHPRPTEYRQAWKSLEDLIEKKKPFEKVAQSMQQFSNGNAMHHECIRNIAIVLDGFSGALRSLNESAPSHRNSDLPTAYVIDWEAAWNHLGETIQGCSENSNDWECRVSDAMSDYAKSEMTLDEFKEEIDLIFRDPTE